MAQRDLGRALMIQYNIGDTRHLAMRRDTDYRQRYLVAKLRVYHQKAIDRAVHQQLRILLDQVWSTEMADCEVEKPFLQQVLLNSEHYAREVSLADLRHNQADRVGHARAQHPGMEVGSVLELFRRRMHSFFSGRRDGFRYRRIV